MRVPVIRPALAGIVLALLAPAAAHAGTYEVQACTKAVGYVNHSWTEFDTSPTYLETKRDCNEAVVYGVSAESANLAAADVRNLPTNVPQGDSAGWVFLAPPATDIVRLEGRRELFKNGDNSWDVVIEEEDGIVLPGQTCTVELVAGYDCEASGPFQVAGLETGSVRIGVFCLPNPNTVCANGATIHDVRAELDEAVVTISDPVAPTDVAGVVPSGGQQGTISIRASATDTIAGVASVSVVNGTNEVIGGPVAAPGGCDFSYVTPCPTNVAGVAVALDTTLLSNGEHSVRIAAENAAHDLAYSPAYTLDVQNPPATEGGEGAGGGSPEGTGGGAGGSGQATGGGTSHSGGSGSTQGAGGQAGAGGGTTSGGATGPGAGTQPQGSRAPGSGGSLLAPAPGPGLSSARMNGCRPLAQHRRPAHRRRAAKCARRAGRHRRARGQHRHSRRHRHRHRHAHPPRGCKCPPGPPRASVAIACPMCPLAHARRSR